MTISLVLGSGTDVVRCSALAPSWDPVLTIALRVLIGAVVVAVVCIPEAITILGIVVTVLGTVTGMSVGSGTWSPVFPLASNLG